MVYGLLFVVAARLSLLTQFETMCFRDVKMQAAFRIKEPQTTNYKTTNSLTMVRYYHLISRED
jgi:hypothetical protein